MSLRELIFSEFHQLGIEPEIHAHPPVFTAEEAKKFCKNIPGLHAKNLFLRDKKHNFFLVVVEAETPVDLKKLSDFAGTRLGFATPDRLREILGVEPGSVSPLCLARPEARAVRVILDRAVERAPRANFHPGENSATATITREDLAKCLAAWGNPVDFFNFADATRP